jgi:Tol biopolymer transport system component
MIPGLVLLVLVICVGVARIALAARAENDGSPDGSSGPKLNWQQRVRGWTKALGGMTTGEPTQIPEIPEPEPGRIIRDTGPAAGHKGMFIAARTGGRNQRRTSIYTARPDGTGIRKIKTIEAGCGSGYYVQLAPSPDGRQLVALLEENDRNSPLRAYRIYADGTGLKRLTDDHTTGVAFSPDGQRIAYTGIKGSGSSELHVMNADGSAQRRRPGARGSILEELQSWSPDGRYVLFRASLDAGGGGSRPNSSGLYALSVGNWQLRRLTRLGGHAWAASYAPDGTKIAFLHRPANDPARQQLYVMNADGSNVQQLTRFPKAALLRPVWSSDGKRIVLGWKRGGRDGRATFRIFSIGPDGRNAGMNTKPLPEGIRWLWIGPSGRHVAYTVSSYDAAVLRLWDLNTGRSTELVKVSGARPWVCVCWSR